MVRCHKNLAGINQLQCGLRKGISTADNIFIVNSLIDHSLYLNKTIYILSYYYATCFDSLWLEDCLLSLINLGVNRRILKMIYELNKKSKIIVKTPFGEADPFVSPRIVKQGTVFGSNYVVYPPVTFVMRI